jgi:hypothetical protein
MFRKLFLGGLLAGLMAVTASAVPDAAAGAGIEPLSPTFCKTKYYAFEYGARTGILATMEMRGCWNGMEAWTEYGPKVPASGSGWGPYTVASKGVTYNADGSKVTWWADVAWGGMDGSTYMAHPKVTLTKGGAWSCYLGSSYGIACWAYTP